jgi:Raf kinase inhibitor-like YbhB/YbcL family protein
MELSSKAFKYGEKIPMKYTCDGDDINPELEIKGVPEKAKSLVLIMDDPDVPRDRRPDGMFDHWVVFNIPPDTRVIAEDSQPKGILGSGTMRLGYQGPCPPDREHRYFFKLYALDKLLNLKEGATKAEVENAMKGHILSSSELMGRYERQRK